MCIVYGEASAHARRRNGGAPYVAVCREIYGKEEVIDQSCQALFAPASPPARLEICGALRRRKYDPDANDALSRKCRALVAVPSNICSGRLVLSDPWLYILLIVRRPVSLYRGAGEGKLQWLLTAASDMALKVKPASLNDIACILYSYSGRRRVELVAS